MIVIFFLHCNSCTTCELYPFAYRIGAWSCFVSAKNQHLKGELGDFVSCSNSKAVVVIMRVCRQNMGSCWFVHFWNEFLIQGTSTCEHHDIHRKPGETEQVFWKKRPGKSSQGWMQEYRPMSCKFILDNLFYIYMIFSCQSVRIWICIYIYIYLANLLKPWNLQLSNLLETFSWPFGNHFWELTLALALR